MGRLEQIDGTNWEHFVASEVAVLMLAKTGCHACAAWTDELTTYLDADAAWPGVRFGKMLLDRPGLAGFKRENPWLAAEVQDLPYTVIYVAGERVKAFAGGGLARLESRLSALSSAG